jgi:late competence protein required for DNA uptake (superfamily II DNA/RNA helicase)
MDNKIDITKQLDEEILQSRLREKAQGTGAKARAARHTLKRQTNKNKNTCPQGHPYNEQNTLYNAIGTRVCLECLVERRTYGEKHKEAQKAASRRVQAQYQTDGTTIQKDEKESKDNNG